MDLMVFLSVCIATLVTNGFIVAAGVFYVTKKMDQNLEAERRLQEEIVSANNDAIAQLSKLAVKPPPPPLVPPSLKGFKGPLGGLS